MIRQAVPEVMEQRQLLAANLHITNAYLIDNTGAMVTSPMPGDGVSIRAEFTTTGLPPGSSYTIKHELQGTVLSNTVSWGAGGGTGSWVHVWGGWQIQRTGPVDAVVTLDADNTIAESDETDNTFTIHFTPPNLPPPEKFVSPLAGTGGKDWFVGGYVDVDPSSAGRDYRGGDHAYDGHDALDIGALEYPSMDGGLAVRAVASGTVLSVEDGHFDRVPHGPNDGSNWIVIDHGNGWQTIYHHMRQGSIAITVGQHVEQGQVIGIIGSSGNSSGPHLHFRVSNPQPVETYEAPDTYWTDPQPYIEDLNGGILDYGLVAYDLGAWTEGERPPTSHVLKRGASHSISFWYMPMLPVGQSLSVDFVRPDGAIVNHYEPANNNGGTYNWGSGIPADAQVGTWFVRAVWNGQELARQEYIVNDTGAPEVMVLDQDGKLMASGRTTPIDIGQYDLGAVASERLFRIWNYGTAPLNIQDIGVPAGFRIVSEPTSAIPTGAKADLTIAVDTSIAGDRYGWVTINSDTYSGQMYRWAVSARVTAADVAASPTVSVYSRDAVGSRQDRDPVIFTVARTGPTDLPLSVAIGLTGTAANGLDYDTVPASVTIPAGANSTKVVITPTRAGAGGSVALTVACTLGDGPYQVATGFASCQAIIRQTGLGMERAPADVSLSNAIVSEDCPPGTLIGTFATADPDLGDTFTYSLANGTGSTDNASFTISGNQLKANASFTYDTKSSYTIRVRSTDAGSLAVEKSFTIWVTKAANHTPTDIALSASNIVERQPVGTTVGTLSTVDPDWGDTFTYSLASGTGSTDNASFAISANQLTANASFTYATKNSYSIRVRTTDSGGLSLEKVFVIGVSRVNHAPVGLSLSNAAVADGQLAGTLVGTLSTIDPDTGDTWTYALAGGTGSTDNPYFSISGSQLKLAYAASYATKNSYAIRVRTTDAGGLTFEMVFAISVSSAGNRAPTDIALSTTYIAENQPIGTVVGSFTTVDPDAGDSFLYTLVSGTGSTDNASFIISSGQLKAAAVFSYASKSSYSIRVRTTDAGMATFEKVFAITVAPPNNHAPTDITLPGNSIAENLAVGTLVGTLSTTDVDAGDSFTYAFISGTGSTDNVSFLISGNQLKSNAYFNFETRNSYSIRVRTTDAGGLWYERSFAINVVDVAEPLVINGTAGNDVIALTTNGATLVVTNNGVAKNYPLATQSSITVNGLAGDDAVIFTGGMPGVTVFGGDGNDSIYGGSGNDYIDCGEGNDLVGAGPGRDTLIGAGGDDQLHGGKDNDCVDGGIGNDSLWGDMAEDVIYGRDGNDVVFRGNGNDTIWGGAGDDDIRAGLGNDVVYGEAGRDTLWGDGGSNTLDGGDDNDVIYARNSLADTVIGGAGSDQAQIDSLLDARPLADVETLLA